MPYSRQEWAVNEARGEIRVIPVSGGRREALLQESSTFIISICVILNSVAFWSMRVASTAAVE